MVAQAAISRSEVLDDTRRSLDLPDQFPEHRVAAATERAERNGSKVSVSWLMILEGQGLAVFSFFPKAVIRVQVFRLPSMLYYQSHSWLLSISCASTMMLCHI